MTDQDVIRSIDAIDNLKRARDATHNERARADALEESTERQRRRWRDGIVLGWRCGGGARDCPPSAAEGGQSDGAGGSGIGVRR